MFRSFLLPIAFLFAGFVFGVLQLSGVASNIAFVVSLRQQMNPAVREWITTYGAVTLSALGFLWIAAIQVGRKWINPQPYLRVIKYGVLRGAGQLDALGGPFVLNVKNAGEETGEFQAQICRVKPKQLFIPYTSLLAIWMGPGAKQATLLPGHEDTISLGGSDYRWDENTEEHKFRLVLQYKRPVKPYDSEASYTKWCHYKGNEEEGITNPQLEIEVTFSSKPGMRGGPLVKRYLLRPAAMHETTRIWHRLNAWYRIRRHRHNLGEGPLTGQVRIEGVKP